jgi:hypothetical protein
MQLTGEDHGGTLRGFASFYMEDQKWTARSGTLGHADKRFQPPSRRDGLMILAIVGVFLAGMTAGGFLFAAYRGQPTVQTASSDDGKTALAFFLNGTPNIAR